MRITHDQMQNNEFELTKEFLVAMPGVHWPSVSMVAGQLQDAGMMVDCDHELGSWHD